MSPSLNADRTSARLEAALGAWMRLYSSSLRCSLREEISTLNLRQTSKPLDSSMLQKISLTATTTLTFRKAQSEWLMINGSLSRWGQRLCNEATKIGTLACFSAQLSRCSVMGNLPKK